RAVGGGAEHTTADAADTGTPRQVRHARTRLPRGEARVIGRLGRRGTARPEEINMRHGVRSAVEASTGRRKSAAGGSAWVARGLGQRGRRAAVEAARHQDRSIHGDEAGRSGPGAAGNPPESTTTTGFVSPG